MQISEYLSCMWYHQNYKIHILQLILRRRLQLAGRDKKQPEPGKLEEGRTAPATEPWSGDQHGTQVPTSPHGASVLPPVSWLSRSPGTSSQPITVLEGGVESEKVSPAIFLSHRSVTPGHTNEWNPVIPKLPHWEVLSSWIQDELQASPHWHSLWLATHQPLHDAANPGGGSCHHAQPQVMAGHTHPTLTLPVLMPQLLSEAEGSSSCKAEWQQGCWGQVDLEYWTVGEQVAENLSSGGGWWGRGGYRISPHL